MKKILIDGKRLRLRQACADDVGYILALQEEPENRKFIVPFEEEYHRETIADGGNKRMSVIVEERDTGESVGYFMLRCMDTPFIEWTHVIIGRKGIGYGREALRLLMSWTFETKKFHRVWIDCKDYNVVALHLYESLGFVREGLLREIIKVDGVYENLVVFGMLDREFFSRN